MELWLQTERQVHLESLVASDDPTQQNVHRIVARFIDHLTGKCREYLVDADEALRHPEPPSDPDYMEYDSESQLPEGLET
jgi:hypothetical protein